jgi:hypothetical protein
MVLGVPIGVSGYFVLWRSGCHLDISDGYPLNISGVLHNFFGTVNNCKSSRNFPLTISPGLVTALYHMMQKLVTVIYPIKRSRKPRPPKYSTWSKSHPPSQKCR